MKKVMIGLIMFWLIIGVQYGCNKDKAVPPDLSLSIGDFRVPAPEVKLFVSDTAYKVSVTIKNQNQCDKDIAFQVSITDGSINYNGRKANQHNFTKKFVSTADTLRFNIKTGVISNPSVVFNLTAQCGNLVYNLSQPIRFILKNEGAKDTSKFSLANFAFNLDSINSILLPSLTFTLISDTSLKGLSVQFTSTAGTFWPSAIGTIDNKGLLKMRLDLPQGQPYLTQTAIKAVLQAQPLFTVDTVINIFSSARAIAALNPVLEIDPDTIIAGDSTSIAIVKVTGTAPILRGQNVVFKTSLGKFLFANATQTYSTAFDNNGVAKAFLYENDTLQTGKGIILVDYYNGLKLDSSINIIR
jgi:hypothetical protein